MTHDNINNQDKNYFIESFSNLCGSCNNNNNDNNINNKNNNNDNNINNNNNNYYYNDHKSKRISK